MEREHTVLGFSISFQVFIKIRGKPKIFILIDCSISKHVDDAKRLLYQSVYLVFRYHIRI